MSADPGYFGPDSMMWKVNKEITVLFGGARALLMHAAHPLILLALDKHHFINAILGRDLLERYHSKTQLLLELL